MYREKETSQNITLAFSKKLWYFQFKKNKLIESFKIRVETNLLGQKKGVAQHGVRRPLFVFLVYSMYMTIEQQITQALKDAMKNKDEVQLSVMRNIKSACTNELVATGKTPQDEVTDELAMAVIKRLAKQRKDSIEQFRNGGREDLATTEEAELAVLEELLPQMMAQEEIRPIAEKKKTELGIEDKSKMGILIGAVMKEIGGQADGADVKAVVESLFN